MFGYALPEAAGLSQALTQHCRLGTPDAGPEDAQPTQQEPMLTGSQSMGPPPMGSKYRSRGFAYGAGVGIGVGMGQGSFQYHLQDEEEPRHTDVNEEDDTMLGSLSQRGSFQLCVPSLPLHQNLNDTLNCTPSQGGEIDITPADAQFDVNFDASGAKENGFQGVRSPTRLTPSKQLNKKRRNYFNSSNCSQLSSMSNSQFSSQQTMDSRGGSQLGSQGFALRRRALNNICNTPFNGSQQMRVGGSSNPSQQFKTPRANTNQNGIVKPAKSPPVLKNPFRHGPNTGHEKERGVHRRNVEAQGRYVMDFKEIEEIGRGAFNKVYRVQRRLDGCLYAVKRSLRELEPQERQTALKEVQAFAAVGACSHVVQYYGAWEEAGKVFIQLELCDSSMTQRLNRGHIYVQQELLLVIRHIGEALQHIHARGIAHLDVKPENIYVCGDMNFKFGKGEDERAETCLSFKLGDFGNACKIGSGAGEEGDARYMPLEILNDDFSTPDLVDIFSLGASIYEVARRGKNGSPAEMLPKDGPTFMAIREGKLTLLPGFHMSFQKLLKQMLHKDKCMRPSAQTLVRNKLPSLSQ